MRAMQCHFFKHEINRVHFTNEESRKVLEKYVLELIIPHLIEKNRDGFLLHVFLKKLILITIVLVLLFLKAIFFKSKVYV